MKSIDALQEKRTEESNTETDTPRVACDGGRVDTDADGDGDGSDDADDGDSGDDDGESDDEDDDPSGHSRRAGGKPQGETPAERKINEHRDALQDLADSDLPAAWVADELLGIVDDRGDAA